MADSKIFNAFNSLPPAPRKFLVFTGINVFSWQCIVGQSLVLFGRALDMPASWVGTLLSFLPLSMVLVIFSVPAVQIVGPRKVLILTWLIRNCFAAFVFAIPLATKFYGTEAAWYILLFSTLGFSLARAFGVGSWYPWLYEIVPQPLLGDYFALETIMVQMINVILILGIGVVLGLTNDVSQFFIVYAFGIAAGLISILFMRKIPGGRKISTEPMPFKDSFAVIFHAIKNAAYIKFVFFVLLSTASFTWVNVASALYLRDVIGYSDTRIMYLFAGGAVMIALTVSFLVRQAEAIGSEKLMALLMAAQVLIAASWCFIDSGDAFTLYSSLLSLSMGSAVSAGFSIIAAKNMMTLIPYEDRVGYTALWILGISFANGAPPIIAGFLIDIFHLPGYRASFLISAGLAFFLCFLWWRFRFEKRAAPTTQNSHPTCRSSLPLRALSRILWIIFGGPDKK
jgi:MFS family permease